MSVKERMDPRDWVFLTRANNQLWAHSAIFKIYNPLQYFSSLEKSIIGFFSFTLKDLSRSSVLKQRRSYPPPANNSTPNDRYLLILGQVCVLCVLNPQAFLIGIGGLWKWFEDVTYQCVTYISTVLKRPRGTDSHEFSPRCSNLQITTYLY